MLKGNWVCSNEPLFDFIVSVVRFLNLACKTPAFSVGTSTAGLPSLTSLHHDLCCGPIDLLLEAYCTVSSSNLYLLFQGLTGPRHVARSLKCDIQDLEGALLSCIIISSWYAVVSASVMDIVVVNVAMSDVSSCRSLPRSPLSHSCRTIQYPMPTPPKKSYDINSLVLEDKTSRQQNKLAYRPKYHRHNAVCQESQYTQQSQKSRFSCQSPEETCTN